MDFSRDNTHPRSAAWTTAPPPEHIGAGAASAVPYRWACKSGAESPVPRKIFVVNTKHSEPGPTLRYSIQFSYCEYAPGAWTKADQVKSFLKVNPNRSLTTDGHR